MKKIFLILFIISTGGFAQNHNKKEKPSYEKIKALKIAVITQQLDLTPAEAEIFWPIFNVFDAKIIALRKKEKNEIKHKIYKGALDSLTDKEANYIIDKRIEMKTSELEYRKELVNNLRGVISPIKIIKLQRAEEQFKKMLLERLRQRKGKNK